MSGRSSTSRPRSRLPGERLADVSVRPRILAAARGQFFVHGFRGVTMDDLARVLGMSKKTLYANFPSKTALLEAMLLDKFRELDAEIAGVTSQEGADFLAVLEGLLASVQRHAAEIQPPFIRDVEREAPELFELVERRRSELIRSHFRRVFEKGRRASLIRKDVPVHLIVEILLGTTHAIVNPAKLLELGLTPESAFHAVTTVLLEGVLIGKRRQKR